MKRKTEIDNDGLNEIIHLSKNLLKITYIIVIAGLILCGLAILKVGKIFPFIKSFLGVILPFFIGFIIAWLFYPLQKKLVDKGMNRVLSSILIFLMIVIVIVLFIYLFIPIVYKQVNDLVSYIPSIIATVTDFVTNMFNRLEIKGIDVESVKVSLITASQEKIINYTSSLPNSIVSMVRNLVSAIGTILISLVIGLYMLIDFDNIKENWKKILPKNNHQDYVDLFENMGLNARRVINGTLLVAFMVFVFDTIGFTLVGLNSAVLFGLLCGITDLIPYIGPYIGGAGAVIVGFTQGPIIGIITLIIVVIVQLAESYVLQPMVMSKAMHLHPVVIIIGLLLFGHFFGIVGMIIATPCIAMLKEIAMFVKRKVK